MKKIFIPAAIAAVMGAGAYFGHATATPSDESDLLLANAEALARDENDDNDNDDDRSMSCVTSVKYTGGYSMPLYCPTCSFRYGYVASGSYSRCKNS